jgi:hypothetical protein
MSNKFYHLKTATPNNTPTTELIDLGAIAINTYDGALFTKVAQGTAQEIVTFKNSKHNPYNIDLSTYSVKPQYSLSNEVTGVASYVIAGSSNTVNSNNSVVIGSNNNTSTFNNVNILGSNITAVSSNFTYVQNISSCGFIRSIDDITTSGQFIGDGSLITNLTLEYPLNIHTLSSTSTLSSSHINSLLITSNTTDISTTIPAGDDFVIGTWFTINQASTGAVTILAGNGVTLVTNKSKVKTAGKGAVATITKVDTNKWFVEGDLISNIGTYWYTNNTTQGVDTWQDLNNWFVDAELTTNATHLPDADTDVVVVGVKGPYVNIDNINWVEPNTLMSIYATTTFKSLSSNSISLNMKGNIVFEGNAHYSL